MVVPRKFSASLLAAGFVSLAVGGIASADISDIVFHIRAQTPDGRFAEFDHHFDPQYFDPIRGFYDWSLVAPISMMASDGTVIATLNTARETCDGDPDVTLNFNVAAGVMNTTFTINSALLGFATIASAQGRSSASVNATDLTGDGVTLAPIGGSTYSSFYNGFLNAGTTFVNLLPLGAFSPIPGDTATASQNFPLVGMVPIGPPITDISSQFHFTLTPFDVAGGTSVFHVEAIPAPGALSLLGLAGLIVSRRRR
jgi:hypothetical protein